MRQERSRISAGSMADIAFLLLVFFLLVTKINQEEGIHSEMPKYTEEKGGTIAERNLLPVSLGRENEMMIGESDASLESLREEVARFYSNSGVLKEEFASPGYPERRWVRGMLEDQETRYNVAFEEIGSFRQLPERCYIQIKSRDDTPYAWYVKVLDEIDGVRNAFRNNLCVEVAGKPLSDLNPHSEADVRLMVALKAVYPNKVVDYWE